MFTFLKELFHKPELLYPSDFALIRYSEAAKENGVFSDDTKIIVRIKNGEEISSSPYTKEKVRILREVAEIPVEEEPMDSNFEFEEMSSFGGITR